MTFPSQMVRLSNSGHGSDMPERIVQLYFVHGWSVASLGRRYRLSKKGVEDTLTRWRHRAVAAGFIQEIQPGKADESRDCGSGVIDLEPLKWAVSGEASAEGERRWSVSCAESDLYAIGDEARDQVVPGY